MRKEGDVLNVGRLLMLNLLRFRRRVSERASRGEASEPGREASDRGGEASGQVRSDSTKSEMKDMNDMSGGKSKRIQYEEVQ